MAWWQMVPAVCIAAALLFAPGFLLARGLGAKGIASLAFSPLASAGLIGVSGIVGGLLHLQWSVWVVAAVTVVCTVGGASILILVRKKLSPVPPSKSSAWLNWIVVLSVLAAASLMTVKYLLPAMGTPDSFGQVYDNIFHLNAIRFILETGNASTLNLGNMTTGGTGIGIYPSVWHSTAALIVQLCGVNVFIAENILTIVTCALIWPFACMVLVRGIVGPKLLPTVAAGVLSTTFWVFPYQTIQWGPLLPNTLSYSILPTVLLIVVALFGMTREKIADFYTLGMLLLVGITALFLIQPNGFSALVAFSIPLAAGCWLRAFRTAVKPPRKNASIIAVVIFGVIALVILGIVWKSLLLNYNDWKPSRSFIGALHDVLTGGLLGREATMLASIVAAVGVITILVRRKGWWIIGCFAIAGGLYMTAAWAPVGPFRHFLTGSWYQDPYRLAALVPLFTIVLASIGFGGVGDFISLTARKLATKGPAWLNATLNKPSNFKKSLGAIVALALSIGILVPVSIYTNSAGMAYVTKKISQSWSFNPGWVVSSPEYILMSRLDETVPADAVIAVDPFNGGSLAYAVSGRKVSEYHLSGGPKGELSIVAKDLATATAGSEVCQLANKLNIQFILDFGSFYMLDTKAAKSYPGFVEIGPNTTLKLIDQEAQAKLYEVVAC